VNLIEHAAGIAHATTTWRRKSKESDDSAYQEDVFDEAGSDHVGVDLNQFLLLRAALKEQEDAVVMQRAPFLDG